MPVAAYVTPEAFKEYEKAAEQLGLHCAAGPMVRSSYRAGEFYEKLLRNKEPKAAVA